MSIQPQNGPFGWIAEYTDCISAEGCNSPNKRPGYDTKQSDYEVPTNAWALGNAEYPFVVISSRYIQTRKGST